MAHPLADIFGGGGEQPLYLPPLREDIALYPGPVSEHGAPTWTLYDPASYRFFRIGWQEFQILERWPLGEAGALVDSINRETPFAIEKEHVEHVLRFAATSNLLKAQTPVDTARLAQSKGALRQSMAQWMLKNYLFFRITLLRPDRLLARLMPRTSFLFTRGFALAVALTACLGLFLVLRQWTEFSGALAGLFSLRGAAMVGVSLILAKIVHEFGHGLAAKKLGCRVPAMGVAFMVFVPLLWTDTTEAWKLKDRRQRLLIDGAGVMAELALAAIASVAWSVLPPGAARTAAHVLASTTWVMTLAVNASPFLRYDGYYLLSDLLDVPDLQTRAFALGRWKLRRLLFNFEEPLPEAMSPGRSRLLIILAFCTWVYRFFLFLGIALLVYHFFFKALGLALMTVELTWFLGLPIAREIGYWRKRVGQSGARSLSWRAWALLAGLLFLLFIPWQRHVTVPAILHAERQATLYCPRGAMLAELTAADGQVVAQGDALMAFSDPDLDHRAAQTERQLDILRHRLSLVSLESDLMQTYRRDTREAESVAADLAGLREMQRTLYLSAPFSGRVTDIPAWLRPGTWVGEGEPVAVLVGGGPRVECFVNEVDLARIRSGGQGRFFDLAGDMAPLPVTLAEISATAVRELPYAELSSTYGGPLPAQMDSRNRLTPMESVYKVSCAVPGEATPTRLVLGSVTLEAESQSIASMVWRRMVGVFIRESGL